MLTLPKYNECSGKDDYETQEFKTKAENISKDIHDIKQNARIGNKKGRKQEQMKKRMIFLKTSQSLEQNCQKMTKVYKICNLANKRGLR